MNLIQTFLGVRLSENTTLPEETSFNSRSIHDDTVLLIVSCVAQNGNNGIDASWQFSKTQIFHGSCCDQRFVRVIEYMCQCVHSHMEVGDIHTHGLFPHSTLKNKNTKI